MIIILILLLFSACETQPDSDSLPTSDPPVEEIPDISTPTPTSEPTEEPATLPPLINPYTGMVADDSYNPNERAVAIMINNVAQSLPQRGVSEADIVYEVVTEGGITRLMAIYSKGFDLPTIGPVRSARDQFIQLMMPYQPIYVHIGSSVTADDMLAVFQYNNRDIDGHKFPDIVWFDEQRAQTLSQERSDVDEHCWFTDGEMLKDVADEYHIDTGILEPPPPIFNFLPPDEDRTLEHPATEIQVKFSQYATSHFVYDEESERYDKFIYGEPQIDDNTGEVLEFDNVFILFTTIDTYADGILANVSYAFGGVGYYFTDGAYEPIYWKKGAAGDALRIVSVDGHETPIEVNSGTSYVGVVDLSHFNEFEIN